MSVSTDQELIRKLRQKRPDWEAERALHTFWVSSYTGDGGFRNGQVPAPAAPFWGRQSYDATLWMLSGIFPVPPYLAGPARQTWSFLVPFRDEDQLSYEDRVNSSIYSNPIEPIVDLTNAFLMADDAVREHVPRQISSWLDNVDGEGRPIQWLAEQTLKQVQLVGYIFSMVELPEDTGANMAESIRLNIHPRVVNIWPQDVLDYDLDGAGRLLRMKIVSYHQGDRASILDERTSVERITIWTRETWERFDIVRDRSVDRIVKHESGTNDLGVVPVCVCRWRAPISTTGSIKGHPQINTLAQMARDLYNRESEHVFNLRQSMFAQLVAPGDPEGDDIPTGPGNVLTEDKDTKGITRYVSPSPIVSEAYERRIEKTENKIYRTAGIDKNDQSRPETAQSREMRFVQTNALLASAAGNLDQWELDLYALVALAYRIPSEKIARITVQRKKDYQVKDLVALLDSATKAKELPVGPTAMAKMTQRIVSHLVPGQSKAEQKQIEQEIDELAEAQFGKPKPEPPTNDVPTTDPGLNNINRPIDGNPLKNSLTQQGK